MWGNGKLSSETKNGLDDKYIIKGNKKLHYGYTTGSCAAAAAQAAARLLFSRVAVDVVRLTTPGGIILFLEPLDMSRTEMSARCAIQKDAGDDPDVTDGLLIYADVRLCDRKESLRQMEQFGWESQGVPKAPLWNHGNDMSDFVNLSCENRKAEEKSEQVSDLQLRNNLNAQAAAGSDSRLNAAVSIRGGEGIGTVMLPGLEQPVGAPAINRVPREMILREVSAVCAEYGYAGGLEVTISAPGGRELSQKTFNPRLGIEGGISILGTSGIVEPMSEQALVATIELEMRQKSEKQKYLLVTPGNYGADYLEGNFPFDSGEAVKCSNYVGQTIDLAVNLELSGLLFVAHIGKFVKVAGGIMNTHSREADARMEILAACALRAGADADCARQILSAVTTDEGLRILRETDVWRDTLDILIRKIGENLNRRAQGRMKIGAVVFSNVYGELGRTREAEELLKKLQE
ncbi:MAG: cobalt-precorrin-5B (C(1))-methyltransferase CbiD [Lachnospiraceae bacterium]|nr:cobalt-precorrin-5B (C(1))-methyltransferase CbiD [Lachnospiraceae bacterium]